MIKLIFIELKKILTKKSIYVMMIIMLLFNLLNNILFYTDYDKEGFYKYQETDNLINQKELLKEELTKYDYNKETDILAYINLKTKLDIIELKENYKVNTWQYNKINDYLYNILEEINIYKYKIEDDKLLQESCLKLEELLIKFKNDDWQYFINLEIKNLEKEQMNLKEQLEMVVLEEEKQELKQLIDNNKFELNILKYRIQNNIREDNNYLNLALNNYIENTKKIKYYQEDSLSYNDLTKDEKKEYQHINIY